MYQTGRKPQYGKERWGRYELLKSRGLLKWESRTLSRIISPQGNQVIADMIALRSRMLKDFNRRHKGDDLSPRQLAVRFSWEVRRWYERRNLTSSQGVRRKFSEGGKPDLMVWYNQTENSQAKKRGWIKGDPDSAPRRNKKGTIPPAGHKGRISVQKARARRRAASFKYVAQGSGVSKQTRDWIEELRRTAVREPSREPELLKQAMRLGFRGKSLRRKK